MQYFDHYETNELTSFYLPTVRVVAAENAENTEHLLKRGVRQALLVSDHYATIRRGGFVVLDFGKELCGGIDLVLHMVDPDRHIRIVFGESVMEALSTVGGEKNATNDHSPREFLLPAPGRSHFTVGDTGFRFVKLEAVDGDLQIANVQAILSLRDVPYHGSFESNDERLNQIWKTGAYTVHLNMQEYLWDGIKRDRLVWIGDMHPEVSTIMSVFGHNPVVEKSLDITRNETPASQWMNTIPSYSMWWIIIHYDWYMQNGNKEYLLEQKSYMMELIPRLLTYVNADGSNSIPDHPFVDWSSNDTEYAPAGVHAVLTLCLSYAAKIMQIYGEEQLAEACEQAAVRARLFKGNYSGNKQVAALTALAGMNSAEEIDRTVLSPGGCDGLSTFMGYYVLQAKAAAGNMSGALDVVRDYWGAMLDFGATTFWEDFDIHWTENAGRIDEIVPAGKRDIHGDCGRFCYKNFRHSLCHGWASGPTAFLSKNVLGVKALEAGCKKVLIAPQLGNLQHVKGTYPTPFGDISVEHTRDGDAIHSEIHVPDGVQAVDRSGKAL